MYNIYKMTNLMKNLTTQKCMVFAFTWIFSFLCLH